MKSNVAHISDVVVSGAQQSGNFTIEANGKAFKILIDGLYSNKKQAIVRELSSNAYDAQIEAGRGDIPFEIRLPNMLDPQFAVRDYGTSLSHENIMGLYTTIFQSTKEDTNNAVGKFGLGSKTPFAYTDSFTVTAYLRGTKRVYGAYMDNANIPRISLMASENTSELDGLMVSFPVNAADCEGFRLETERVVQGFDVKPVVKGASINMEPPETLYEGPNFKILKKINNGTKILAKQGCVIYPIDVNALSDSNISSAANNILKTNILIDFPIGQLDVTPSRETLSYDADTIRNILTMCEKIDAELVADISKSYSAVKTMYEAKVFKAANKTQFIPSITHFIENLEFNSKKVGNYSSMARHKLKSTYGCNICHFSSSHVINKTLKFGDSKYDSNWEIDGETFFVTDKENERIVHASARIKNNLGDKSEVVWIRNFDATDKQWRKMVKLLGYPPKIHNIADLEKPERAKAQYIAPRIAKNECHVERVNANGNLFKETIDLNNVDKDTVYVIAFKTDVMIDVFNKASITFSALSKYFKDLNNVIIVRNQNLAKIKKAGIPDGLMKVSDELFAKIDFARYYESQNIESIMDDRSLRNNADEFSGLSYDKDTSFKKVLDLLLKYAKRNEYEANDLIYHRWSAIAEPQIINDMQKKYYKPLEQADHLSYWVNIFRNDYPISHYILGTGSYNVSFDKRKAKDLVNYVELIDRTNNLG